MKVKCNYCGSMIDETEKSCPRCNAPLSGANRVADQQPKTIEELKTWYVGHHLPPEEITRFFIGKDIREPKAFGIYKNSVGDCVVYKNKSTGERAIRYQGADEAYAVNELYQRLKAEIADQKQARPNPNPPSSPQPQKKKRKGCLIFVLIFTLAALITAIFDNSAPNGYYSYQGQQYYHQGSSWYYYDPKTDDWYKSDDTKRLDKEINDDNASEYRYYSHQGKDFESTSWYDAGHHNNDSDWDNDSNWDSGGDSWDSNDTDWDSDW